MGMPIRSGMSLGTRMRGQRIWPRGITVTTIANVSDEAELGSLFFQNAAHVGGAADAFQILGGRPRQVAVGKCRCAR